MSEGILACGSEATVLGKIKILKGIFPTVCMLLFHPDAWN
jgi:hypothetical protein